MALPSEVTAIGTPQRGWFSRVVYDLVLAAMTICAIAPLLLVPIPGILPYPLLLAPVAAGVVLYRARGAQPDRRQTMLRFAVAAAGMSVAATLIMVALPPFPVPVPDIINRLFQPEGITAYRTSVYELWCEVWACLALLSFGLYRLVSRVGRAIRSPQ
jgi:hypothetical protein